MRDWGGLRRIVSRAGCRYAEIVLGAPVKDLTGRLKCFRAQALRALGCQDVRSPAYGFQIEATYGALRDGQAVVEVPIVFRNRRPGRSKMSARIAFEAASRVPAMRWRRGARQSAAAVALRPPSSRPGLR